MTTLLDDAGLQEKYVAYIRTNKLDDLKTLQDRTGIKPAEDLIQAGYATYIRRHARSRVVEGNTTYFNYFGDWGDYDRNPTALKTIKQIKESAKPKYFFLEGILRLQEITGIKPSEKVVQAGYDDSIEHHCSGVLLWKELQEITGVKPSAEVVQKVQEYYIHLSQKGEMDRITEIYLKTQIAPSDETKAKIFDYWFKK